MAWAGFKQYVREYNVKGNLSLKIIQVTESAVKSLEVTGRVTGNL
jgi:hypothetical protein